MSNKFIGVFLLLSSMFCSHELFSGARFQSASSEMIFSQSGGNPILEKLDGAYASTLTANFNATTLPTIGTIFGASFASNIAGLQMLVRNSGSIVECGGKSQNADAYVRSTAPVTAGINYFAACIFDYQNDLITLYLNGEIARSQPVAFGSSTFTYLAVTSTNSIGNRAGVSAYFNGYIDDVRIYRRALSDSEIKTLAFSGIRFVITDGLVAQYRMDEGPLGGAISGTGVVKDTGPYGLHMTNQNSPTWQQSYPFNLNYP